MPKQLKIRNEGAVRVIEFSNPPQNYITHVMLQELYDQLLRDRGDASVRVLVLTGGLKDTFVTHYSVDELIDFRRTSPGKMSHGARRRRARVLFWLSETADRWPWLDRLAAGAVAGRSVGEQSIYYWTRCIRILDDYPKPVIAAINGLCLGGGCEIALRCHFRYMADSESCRIGLPEVLIGITPGGTGTPLRLPRIVGEAKALEMLLTGRIYRPAKARSMGLIHEVAPPGDLAPLAMRLGQKLARGAPLAQAAILRGVREGGRLPWSQGRVLEMAAAMRAMSSDDAESGMSAYVTLMASRFEGVDPEERLALFDDLYEGRLATYRGE